MDIAFIGEQDKFMVFYLDDITVFFKTDEENILHLKLTFEKCRRYGLSLNPKKSQFSLSEGNLLGHIVAQEGVKINPKQVKAIIHIPLPINKKEVPAFLGRINLLRRFIPNYVEIIKGIKYMLKKENEVMWSSTPRDYFIRIKEDLAKAPVLVSPDYSVPFYIFSFASPHTIIIMLLQKNKEGSEQPISFFSQVLRDVEMKYNILEKQSYGLVKALNEFRMYVLQLEITTFVPMTTFKDILVQGDKEGKRGGRIEKIQEYELEIKPTNLIKGQGFLSEPKCQALGINLIIEEGRPEDHQSGIKTSKKKIYAKYEGSPWYKNIVHYLLFLRCPLGLDKSKYQSLRLQVQKYIISNGLLYWEDPVGVLWLCLVEGETQKVIEDFSQRSLWRTLQLEYHST